MSRPIIEVRDLSKVYRLGAIGATSLGGELGRLWAKMRGREGARRWDEFWALRDVSFAVRPGEVVGIIGRNGAGKSTLLKILSRITQQTAGEVTLRGRVASLLEVGTGFHPDLTGRENVFLNGAILGMTKADIKKKFDEIVAFAEIEQFIDTPVKRYSSGMYVRLAFAVAAHLEPEILLVDEVLAVGDVAFQKKCLGKMGEVVGEGRTILFVSHNIAAVRKLCGRAVLLDSGKIVSHGATQDVLDDYVGGDRTAQSTFVIPAPAEGDLAAWSRRVTVLDEQGRPAAAVPVGRPWQIRVDFTVARPLEHFIVATGLLTRDGNTIRLTYSTPSLIQPGEYSATFREESVMLGSARYHIAVGLSDYHRSIHYVEEAGILDIAPYAEGDGHIAVQGAGTVLNPMKVDIMRATA
jgi:lipopolysaccharide transport system ATP-binding protein